MIKGIVFDKDGTLTDFHATWMPAIDKVVDLFAKGDEALKHRLLVAGGWDPETNRITSGSILGAGDLNDLLDCFLDICPGLKPEREAYKEAVGNLFTEINEGGIVPSTDLSKLFCELRARDIQIGVATMDLEEAAHLLLKNMGLADFVSYVAGYDSGKGVKPSGDMVRGFMEETGIDAEHIMVAGDNSHDTEMGKDAGVAKVIGVLTGNSLPEDFDGHADHVLASIADIPALLDQLYPKSA